MLYACENYKMCSESCKYKYPIILKHVFPLHIVDWRMEHTETPYFRVNCLRKNNAVGIQDNIRRVIFRRVENENIHTNKKEK